MYILSDVVVAVCVILLDILWFLMIYCYFVFLLNFSGFKCQKVCKRLFNEDMLKNLMKFDENEGIISYFGKVHY